MRARTRVVNAMPLSLVIAVLIISFSAVMKWIDHGGRAVKDARLMASADALRGARHGEGQRTSACAVWADMSLEEKRAQGPARSQAMDDLPL